MPIRLVKVLFILLFVEGIILAYSFVAKEGMEIILPKDKHINFKSISFTELFSSKQQSDTTPTFNKKQLSSILSTSQQLDAFSPVVDKRDDEIKKSKPITRAVLPVEVIQTPSSGYLYNSSSTDFKPLDLFFKSLSQQVGIVRIAHFGDSQIEGDRLSSNLRSKFQHQFGGSGLGYIPLTDITTHINLLRKEQENWERYTVFTHKRSNGYYGLSGVVFQLSTPGKEGKVALSMYKQVSYRQMKLMYGRSNKPTIVKTKNTSTDELIAIDTLLPKNGFGIASLSIPANTRDIEMLISSAGLVDVYGLLAEGESGVQVDNFAIRGHAGNGLLKMDKKYIVEQVRQLNTKLLIFQFGANVVPYAQTPKQIAHFQKAYATLFRHFKQALPGVSILVIGVGDMAKKSGGEHVSYPQIYAIKEAQKTAALQSGCAFWDLYEVMGGKGAILEWSKNGLASPDGHLTTKGQQTIAHELYNALMIAYNAYITKHQPHSLSQLN